MADEKHSRLHGEKIDIATTAGGACMLGASVAHSAAESALAQADGVLAEEARAVDPDSAPATVNTDGGPATPAAWKSWFAGITIRLCFLPAFLKSRDRATKALTELVEPVRQTVGWAYRAPTKAACAHRRRRLREGATRTLPDSAMKQHPLDLCEKRAPFSRSDDHERAHRTRNRVDRLMKFLDRAGFTAPYFHGTLASAE